MTADRDAAVEAGGQTEDEQDRRMAAVSDEAVRIAEEVWAEEEPTLAEYELTERILAARRAPAPVEDEPVLDGPSFGDYWPAESQPEHRLIGNVCSCGGWSAQCGEDVPGQWAEHVRSAPVAGRGDADVEVATGSMRSAVEVGPGCYTEVGWHALCERTLAWLDNPAPLLAAREHAAKAEGWHEALRWVRQQAEVTSPEYVLDRIDRAEPFNPYRAASYADQSAEGAGGGGA